MTQVRSVGWCLTLQYSATRPLARSAVSIHILYSSSTSIKVQWITTPEAVSRRQDDIDQLVRQTSAALHVKIHSQVTLNIVYFILLSRCVQFSTAVEIFRFIIAEREHLHYITQFTLHAMHSSGGHGSIQQLQMKCLYHVMSMSLIHRQKTDVALNESCVMQSDAALLRCQFCYIVIKLVHVTKLRYTWQHYILSTKR